MPVNHWDSYSLARKEFRAVLDAAGAGKVATVARGKENFLVAPADRLRSQIAQLLPANASLVAEGGGWAALLPGVPIAGDGEGVNEAVDDLIDALREYAQDWDDHLRLAPNHARFSLLVTLVELSTDEQLRHWVEGTESSEPEVQRARAALT